MSNIALSHVCKPTNTLPDFKFLQESRELIWRGCYPSFWDDPYCLGISCPKLSSTVSVDGFVAELSSAWTLTGNRWLWHPDGLFISDRIEDLTSFKVHGPDIIAKDRHSKIYYDIESSGYFRREAEFKSPIHLVGRIGLAVFAEPSNWGSFLVRCLPKIVALRSLRCDKILVYCKHDAQRDLIKMTGWEDKDIILHNPWREYTADTFIFMPEMSKGLYLSSFARSVLRWMSKRGCGGDKIFVSRSGGLAARSKRQCLNGDRVESAMRKLGYSIFVPDRCSVVEQILTFSNARSIVGPSGAGMFNSVFCGADTCIVDIESQTNWLNSHVNLFSSLDVEFGVHWAKADLGVNSVQKPYLIDVDALCSLIESRQVSS